MSRVLIVDDSASVRALLGERLRYTAGAVHPSYCMEDALATIGENALCLFALFRVADWAGSPKANQQAEVAHLQRARNNVL